MYNFLGNIYLNCHTYHVEHKPPFQNYQVCDNSAPSYTKVDYQPYEGEEV